MIKIAKSLDEKARSAAKEMLAAGTDLAPLLSPDGDPMFYLATDKSRLRATFMSVDIDGVTVFVGLLADEPSLHA